MMGMVFTELLDLVEARFSLDVVDAVIARAGARGAYTSVGYYEDRELVAIVEALSIETGVPVSDLLFVYGEHLFGRFQVLHPEFFGGDGDAIAFLQGLESHVHTEVRKLYATAHPPLFQVEPAADGETLLTYRSPRGLARFAEGLLTACLRHHGDAHRLLAVEDRSGGAGTEVCFRLGPR